MKISTSRTDPTNLRSPLLVVPLALKERFPKGFSGVAFSQASLAIKKGDFTGKSRETLLVYGPGGGRAKGGGIERLLLVGLGDRKALDAEAIRRIAAVAFRQARLLRVGKYHFLCPKGLQLEPSVLGEALSEGARLASWRYAAPRREAAEEPGPAPDLQIVIQESAAQANAGVKRGDVVAQGTNVARELAISPANALTPSVLARKARQLARSGGLSCKVMGVAELERLKMGGILGVARGSKESPCLIILDYSPRGARHTICLVGKGLTFDSGGLSLKPAKSMEEMKYDMCGAAAVLGTLRTVASLEPRVRVVGIIPATENMPGGRAIKPGDVLRTHGGLTVEVLNTDAEGRLVLADALEYAKRFDPTVTIDVATLTGAVVVALGHEASGCLSTDDALVERILAAGEACGERLWRLPLWPEYGEVMKSSVADIANIGGRGAGTITAAWFLSRFAEGMRWAHLDIAGTAWDQRSRDYYESGPSGVGVRILTRLVEDWR